MSFTNRLRKGLLQMETFPQEQRSKMLNAFIRSQVKVLDTVDAVIESLQPMEAVVSLANQPKVQNHIGTIHAAMMTLVAETATGMVVTMNIPDDKIQVAKSMQINFVKKAQGALKAIASLTEEQAMEIQTEEKGNVSVKVKVTDEAGNEPMTAEIVWAWYPAQKKETVDDAKFLKEEVKKALDKLHPSKTPAWGTFQPQQMVEHLTDALRKSYMKAWDKSREESEKQKQYKSFFYDDNPFPKNLQNPLFKDGVPPLHHPDLESAKAEMYRAMEDFFTYFEQHPEETFFHIFAGEMTFRDLKRFHVKHFTHHLIQFELL